MSVRRHHPSDSGELSKQAVPLPELRTGCRKLTLIRLRLLDKLVKNHLVGVAQPVERWIVVPVAEGSNPSTHPKPVTTRAAECD